MLSGYFKLPARAFACHLLVYSRLGEVSLYIFRIGPIPDIRHAFYAFYALLS